MKNFFFKLHFATRVLMEREDAQDLVEYGLVVALISCVCIAGVNHLASAVTGVFSRINKALF